MASLEPPIPASAAHVFEVPLGHATTSTTQEQDTQGWNVKASSWAKWRRSVGLLLLFVTVFLWTVSNFLASVRNLCRYASQVKAANENPVDNLRGQHLQQTVLCHLPQHGVFYYPPHTDPDPQSPEPTRGTRKMAVSMPRRTTTQILPGPAAAGRIAVREICARVAVQRRPRRVTTTLTRRRRSGRIGRDRAS